MSVRTDGPAEPPRMPLAERFARSLGWFAGLVVVSLGCEIVGHAWCLWPTRKGSAARVRRSNWIVRTWGTAMYRLTTDFLRVRVVIDGEPPPGRYVVVSNHQSTADIAILIAVLSGLECKFVAKSQLGWGMPSISTALSRMGGALITRRATKRDADALARMGEGLEGWNGSAVIFAEGRRSRDGALRPYHAGALRLVGRAARLPLLPVALDGTHVASDLAAFVHGMPGARFGVWIGEPVPFQDWSEDVDGAVARIRSWAAERIGEGRRTGVTPDVAGWTPVAASGDDSRHETA